MFSILMTSLTDKPLILQWEVWLRSLLGLKGFILKMSTPLFPFWRAFTAMKQSDWSTLYRKTQKCVKYKCFKFGLTHALTSVHTPEKLLHFSYFPLYMPAVLTCAARVPIFCIFVKDNHSAGWAPFTYHSVPVDFFLIWRFLCNLCCPRKLLKVVWLHMVESSLITYGDKLSKPAFGLKEAER